MICTLYISTFLSSFKQKQKVDRFHAEIDESGHLHKYSRMNIVFLEIQFYITVIFNLVYVSIDSFQSIFRLRNFQDCECLSCRIAVKLIIWVNELHMLIFFPLARLLLFHLSCYLIYRRQKSDSVLARFFAFSFSTFS